MKKNMVLEGAHTNKDTVLNRRNTEHAKTSLSALHVNYQEQWG
jgi:hypothetical protein